VVSGWAEPLNPERPFKLAHPSALGKGKLWYYCLTHKNLFLIFTYLKERPNND